MKRLEPRIPVGLLVGERRPVADPVARVREFGADYFAPQYTLVTGAMVAALHAAGIPVVAWTVNQPEAMRRLVDLGIGGLAGDAIISDYPDRALELRRQLGG
jgi:glycerophosphoryl diester phosphodiesterase